VEFTRLVLDLLRLRFVRGDRYRLSRVSQQYRKFFISGVTPAR
jgi:hypothetical protein